MKTKSGVTRLVTVVSLVLGIAVAWLTEAHLSWPKFLESEAQRIAWKKEFPSRDPGYRSTSETPTWEDSVDLQKYEKELQELLRLSEIREYKSGTLIFEEGTYDGCIYYLVYGTAKIVKNGKEVSVLKSAGDIFGEMGVLDDSVRSASVYAKYDCMCLAINIADIDSFSARNESLTLQP